MNLKSAFKETTEVMRKLVATLSTASPLTSASQFVPQALSESEYSQHSAKTVVTEQIADIESLDIFTIAALTNMYRDKAGDLTIEKLRKVRDYENSNKKDRLTDALYLTLNQCEMAKKASRALLLALSNIMLQHWNELGNDDDRRAFAERYLETPAHQRAALVPGKSEQKLPDETLLFEQARALIKKLVIDGYRNQAVAILNEFGARKLGQVAPEHLTKVIVLAEQRLKASNS